MDRKRFKKLVEKCLDAISEWRAQSPPFEEEGALKLSFGKVEKEFSKYFERLIRAYPFHSPFYAAQMMKPPHPVAVLAYFTALNINPNNHALDGGPSTSAMEVESVSQIARMFGFSNFTGHLTSGGTVANLEALFISRSLHPDKLIAYSDLCHYTHPRLCHLLNTPSLSIRTDGCGRLDLNDLEVKLRRERIGTVVVTLGTTGLGAWDPLDEIVRLRERYGFRIHIDAAYGGFFRLLAERREPVVSPEPFKSIKYCDSIVVDPHKHGLQPYGCGCVLFTEPEKVVPFYKHDSPYTYFTSRDLHLGEISLECSRAGAAAAALWLTLRCFPLKPNTGLGAILFKTRCAALKFAQLANKTEDLEMVVQPELDIVAYFPRPQTESEKRASWVSEMSERLFKYSMEEGKPRLYLAKMRIKPPLLSDRYAKTFWDVPEVTVLRSVLMKPEHFTYIRQIHSQLLKNLTELRRKPSE
ncbi:MAG: aminotransferase class V-fold PLP-dependent enzyme [Planctomycetota bacterium]|nr:aminotransferase class V-fold PLP-dependent enzyme [Planctomycetota bacterium]